MTSFKQLESYTTLSQFTEMIGKIPTKTVDLQVVSYWNVTFVGINKQVCHDTDVDGIWNAIRVESGCETKTSVLYSTLKELVIKNPYAAVVMGDSNKSLDSKIVTNVVTKVIVETKEVLLHGTVMNCPTNVANLVVLLNSAKVKKNDFKTFMNVYGSKVGYDHVFLVDDVWATTDTLRLLIPALFADNDWAKLFKVTDEKLSVYESILTKQQLMDEFRPKTSRADEILKKYQPADIYADMPALEDDKSSTMISLNTLLNKDTDKNIYQVTPIGNNRYCLFGGSSVYEKIGAGLVLIGFDVNGKILPPTACMKHFARNVGVKVLDSY